MKNFFKTHWVWLVCVVAVVLIAGIIVGAILLNGGSHEPSADAPHTGSTSSTPSTGDSAPTSPEINPSTAPTVNNTETLPITPTTPTGDGNMSGNGTVENPDPEPGDKDEDDEKPSSGGSSSGGNSSGGNGSGGNSGGSSGGSIGGIPVIPSVDPDDYTFTFTPATITRDDWNAMSLQEKSAFQQKYPTSEMTAEERHNFYVAKGIGYDCGVAGHSCRNKVCHDDTMAGLATQCRYCGKTNCPSWLALDNDLFTTYKAEACPEYTELLDPAHYCQTCGKPKAGDYTEICILYLGDTNCHYCGVPVEGWTCHTCKQEDIDNYNP